MLGLAAMLQPRMLSTEIQSRTILLVYGLLSCLVNTDVEYVTSAQNEIPKIRCRRIASVLGRSVQDYVHVTIAVDHPAAIFYVILQSDSDV